MSAVPPAGTVTFLFTDVEGSTAAWDRDPEGTGSALGRHDRIVRAAIEGRGGHVFKTVGDAFCAAFARAGDAVAAALDAQRRLADGAPAEDPIARRVRIAVLTGEAEERDGDYFGRAVNRTARLLALGHGGQVLVAEGTAGLVAETLPDGAALVDYGEHRLRDLERPEVVHGLAHPDLGADFPPLRSLDAERHNLPLQPTSFVGRERELGLVEALVREHRLVTLTGIGGCGKTRIALQVAADLIDEFPDGVWLAELASRVEPDAALQAVAGVLHVREAAGRPLRESVVETLSGRAILIILDNCEHVIESAARLADAVVRGTPETRVLATSREPLGTAGEQVWVVPSLSVPGGVADDRETPAEALRSEALRLFVERARLVDPAFAVDDENLPALIQICRRLDGIPLAIELAAARLRVLSPAQIAARLDDRFRLLAGGSRTGLPRHRTLRAAIDWSHDHLDDDERRLLRRLSVFSGSFTLEAVDGVCGEGFDDVLDPLARLVETSLVLADTGRGLARYRMLETVRQYAFDRLVESSETVALRDRHRDWFAGRYGVREPIPSGPEPVDRIERIEADHDNLLAALDWALESEGGAGAALALAVGLNTFWLRRGDLGEGIDRVERALAGAADAEIGLRCNALRGLAGMLGMRGDRDRGREAAGRSLELAREWGDPRAEAYALRALGTSHIWSGDPDRAAPILEEALGLVDEVGNPHFESLLRISLGEAARLRNRLDDAATHYQRAIEVSERVGDESSRDILEFNLGQVALARGDAAAAAARYRAAIAHARRVRRKFTLAYGLAGTGQVLAEVGEPEAAARLFGAAERIREEADVAFDTGDREIYEGYVERVRGALGRERYEAARKAGRGLGEEEAVVEAERAVSRLQA